MGHASGRPGRRRSWRLGSLLLLAGLGVGAAYWWYGFRDDGVAAAVTVFEPAPSRAVPLAAEAAGLPERPIPAALPQLRVPPDAAGQDPLAAALKAAREVPLPPPPPEIATARSLEQAFAAMVAAQADAAVQAAGTSPFGAR